MENIALIDGQQRFFSDNLPAELGLLLNRASGMADPAEKEAQLLSALDKWPAALDAHIALYKLYFRTARYKEAEVQVWRTLKTAASLGGFRWNYRFLVPDSAAWLEDQSVARLYLFSLKALGVVRLRRGRVALAHRVLSKLLQLDIHDEIGGSSFLGIAAQFLAEEMDQEMEDVA